MQKKKKKTRPNVIHFEAYWSHFNTHAHTKQSASCLPEERRIKRGVAVDTAVVLLEEGGGGTGMVWWTWTTTTTTATAMTRRKCNTGRFTLSRARRNSQLHGAEDLPNDGRLTLISKPLRTRTKGRGGVITTMAWDDERGNGAHQDGGHPGIVCSAGG